MAALRPHDTSPVLELARELIARPSVTPDDAGCQALLAKRLEAVGFQCEHLRFGEVDNLWATLGSGEILAFVGHTDVVPTGDETRWQHPPFTPTVVEGSDGALLFGRGAADMKGSIAAAVIALERIARTGLPTGTGLGFLMTSDEEGPGIDGVKRVMATLAERGTLFQRALVIEPSSRDQLGDVVRVGRRGSLGAHLIVRGIQGHVAYPHLARNPIHEASAAIAELVATEWDTGNEYFPATTLQFSNISAGTGVDNVIPGELSAQLNFRFSTECTPEGLKAAVETLLDAHGLDYEIHWRLSGSPFLTDGGRLVEAVVSCIQAQTGLETELSTGGGTSDGRFIAPYGIEVVELGLVNASIHKVDEHARVSDLLTLADLYESIARRVLTGQSS